MARLNSEDMHWDEWFSHMAFWHSCIKFQNDSKRYPVFITIDKYHPPSSTTTPYDSSNLHHTNTETLSHSLTLAPGQIHFHEFTDYYVRVTITYVSMQGKTKELCGNLLSRGGRCLHITDKPDKPHSLIYSNIPVVQQAYQDFESE